MYFQHIISRRFAWISLSVVNDEISFDCDIYSVQFVIVISHQFYCKEDRLRGMLNNRYTEQTYYVIVMTPVGTNRPQPGDLLFPDVLRIHDRISRSRVSENYIGISWLKAADPGQQL